MDFALTEAQQLLTRTATDFVAAQSPTERARHMKEDARGWDPALFAEMGELGWLGVAFPEGVGGGDGTMLEACLLLERLGASVVPEPYLDGVLLPGSALFAAGDAAQHDRFLRPCLEGRTSLALAHTEADGRGPSAPPSAVARAVEGGFILSGDKRWVRNGHAADFLVLSATLDGRPALFVVAADAPGVTRTKLGCVDGRSAAHVSLRDVFVQRAHHLAGDASEALEFAFDRAAAGAIATALGGAQTMLDMTIDHLKTRRQFRQPLGAFQSLQHRAAQMFIELELLRSASLRAMVLVDAPDATERRRAVSAGKAQLGESGRYIARQAVQLHGAIAMTEEHDMGLFYKRQQALEALYGDTDFHLRRFAGL